MHAIALLLQTRRHDRHGGWMLLRLLAPRTDRESEEREVLRDAVRRLLHANLNCRTLQGATPLMLAAGNNDVGMETLRELLGARADPGLRDWHGHGVLHWTSVRYNLTRGVAPFSHDLFNSWVSMRDLSPLGPLAVLLHARADAGRALPWALGANMPENFVYLLATMSGKAPMKQLLLARAALQTLPSGAHSTPLHWSIERSPDSPVQAWMLLERLKQVHEEPEDLEEYFADEGCECFLCTYEVVSPVDALREVRRALRRLPLQQHRRLLPQQLLEARASANCRNALGQTPLWLALRRCRSPRLVQRLLEAGASANATPARALSPVGLAISAVSPHWLDCFYEQVDAPSSHIKKVRLLLKHRASVNGQGAGSRTPLTVAIAHYNPARRAEGQDIIKLLLRERANPNRPGTPALRPSRLAGLRRYTPLVAALVSVGPEPRSTRLQRVRCLLGARACVNLLSDGRTPLQYLLETPFGLCPAARLKVLIGISRELAFLLLATGALPPTALTPVESGALGRAQLSVRSAVLDHNCALASDMLRRQVRGNLLCHVWTDVMRFLAQPG